MCWYCHRFWKWRRRSIRLNPTSRSATCWLNGFWDFPMLLLISPINMGSWSWKHVRASFKSGKCSRVEGRIYALIIWVRFPLVMTSQLTTFGPWNCAASKIQPCGWSWTTRNPPSQLHIARQHHVHWKSHQVVSNPVEKISLVSDIGLHQYH